MSVARARSWLLAGDRWIPGLFILFFVGLAIIEARLVTIAISSSTGLVTEAPRQDTGPGWGMSLDVPAAPVAATATEIIPITLRLTARDGRPLGGASVHAVAERPSRYAQIVSVQLVESEGRYTGALRLPIGGRWDLTIIAERGDDRMQISRALDVNAGSRP